MTGARWPGSSARDKLRTDEIEAAGDAAWRLFLRPARRPTPRVAPILTEAAFAEVSSGSATVAVWRHGDGPAALLVHGWSDDHTIWTPLMNKLAARGKAFVAIDLPGHGLSSGTECALRLSTDAVRAVAETAGPVDAIVGHSLGGLAGALAIAEGLAVERAVIIGTSTNRRPRIERHAVDHDLDDRVVAYLEARHAARFGEADMQMGIPDFASGLTTPALIIHSFDDEAVPIGASDKTQQAWAGSELWQIHGPSHRQSARVPEVVERVADYLEGGSTTKTASY